MPTRGIRAPLCPVSVGDIEPQIVAFARNSSNRSARRGQANSDAPSSPPSEKGEDSDGPGPRSCDNRILYQKPAPHIPVSRTEPYGPSGEKQEAPIEGDFIG